VESEREPAADAVVEGGDLDCGSGLLLILRDALEPLPDGGVLELRSRETSVKEDLPAWCRMVGHTLVLARAGEGRTTHYFLRKKAGDDSLGADLARAKDFRWQVRASWSGGLESRIYARNHALDVGQPASFETADKAPSAIELLLGALGGCLTSGFAWRASKRGVELRALEISLAARADNILVFLGLGKGGHPGLAGIEGTLYVDADGADDVLDELWRETVDGSPVAQTLLRGAPLAIEMRRA
jgi:TusA-related sulfurtransferase